MKLVEQHIITKSNKEFKKIDKLCWLSKNLYNASLYFIRKFKETNGKWIRYNNLEKEFRLNCNPDYVALPSNSSQQILMIIDKNLRSYFKLLSKWKKNKTSLSGCPKFPKYKDKIKGRNLLIFTSNQARFKSDQSIIIFPKRTNLKPLKTKIKGKLNQVRIIPKSSCYVIEVVYEKQEEKLININEHYLSIDIGLNNLLTCFDTKNLKAFIVDGKPIKSMNQYYNKEKGKLQSDLKKNHNQHKSKKLDRLDLKRNNKIKDYLHKSSRFVVDYCLKNQIFNLLVGYNLNWKTSINLGKRNNQNFVQIPFKILIDQLKYKGDLVGLNVLSHEESYTSKCSALDLEEICKHENYIGQRIKRGLFKSSKGTKINADLNGALNILRKEVPNKGQEIVQTLRYRGQGRWPMKLIAS